MESLSSLWLWTAENWAATHFDLAKNINVTYFVISIAVEYDHAELTIEHMWI